MSRIVAWGMALAAASQAAVVIAQERESLGTYSAQLPERVDILADPPPPIPDKAAEDECRRQQDVALVRGEIVVCAPPPDTAQYRLEQRGDSQARYARETNRQGEFGAPDGVNGVAGNGIFRGKPSVGGLCVIPPCPPPPVYMIDFSSLPETPPGSDADRVGRGLPPRGEDDAAPQPPVIVPEQLPPD